MDNKKRRLNLGQIIRKINEESDKSLKSTRKSNLKKDDSDFKYKFPTKENNTVQHSESNFEKQPNYSANKHTKRYLKIPIDNNLEKVKNERKVEIKTESLKDIAEVKDKDKFRNIDEKFKIEHIAPTLTNSTDLEEDFDFYKYLEIIIRRREVIILLTLIIGIYSIISYLGADKYYTSKARMLFKPDEISAVDNNLLGRKLYQDKKNDFNTHLELLKSVTVLGRVAENLGNENIRSGIISRNLSVSKGEINGEETNIIELTYKSSDPLIAKDVLNELMSTYIEYRREVNAQEDSRLIAKLKTQINKVQNDLADKENSLRIFKEKNNIFEMSNSANLISSKLSEMELDLQKTNLAIVETKDRLESLKKQISKQEVNVIQSMSYSSPIKAKIAELQLELNSLLADYSPDHFKVKNTKAQISELKQALQSNINKKVEKNATSETYVKNPIRESLLQTYINQTIEYSTLSSKVASQKRIIEQLSKEMNKLPSIEQEYSHLVREKGLLEQTLQRLKVKYEQAKIKRDSKESDLKILELAKVPTHAVSTKKKSTIPIGFIIGIMLGIGIAFLLEFLDQSIKDPSSIENDLEIPLLGMVPNIETSNAIVTKDDLSKTILEPFRALRININHIAQQNNSNIFMLCSAVKGEGKTTLSTNLAITFSLDNKKVILVDCDLRRSQIHTLLNTTKENGLSDYLSGRLETEDIIKNTHFSNLSIITSGKRPSNPSELLGNDKFKELIDTLRKKADIVILDSPALIPVSDALVISPFVDNIIVTVRSLWTPLKAAKHAKNQLKRLNANIVGGILNGVEQSKGYYPYYYGYYGYYSYKYSYEDNQPVRPSIRELGIRIEESIKSFILNIPSTLTKEVARLSKTLPLIIRNGMFIFILAILAILIGIRFYIFEKNKTEVKPGRDIILIDTVPEISFDNNNTDENDTSLDLSKYTNSFKPLIDTVITSVKNRDTATILKISTQPETAKKLITDLFERYNNKTIEKYFYRANTVNENTIKTSVVIIKDDSSEDTLNLTWIKVTNINKWKIDNAKISRSNNKISEIEL